MSTAADGTGPQGTPWLPLPQPVPRPWLVFALLGLLLLLRRPDDLLRPQFNAEEGSIFFQQAYNDGFWASLFSVASGYFHLALHLTAGLALLAPLELAPAVFKMVALAIQMLPVAYLLADGIPGFVVTPLFRVLVAAACVAGPNTVETYLNVLNAQWYLALAGCLVLLAGPRPGKLRQALDTGVLLLFAASGPLPLVCSPLALWSWLRARRAGATGNLGPLIVLAGAAAQLALLLTGSRATAATAGFGTPTPAEIVRIIGLHGACNSLLGVFIMMRNHQAFSPAATATAAAILPLLAFAAIRLRNLALAVLLVLAITGATVLFVFPLNDPRFALFPGFAPRYFFFTTLFVLFTLLAMAERGGTWRLLALPGLAAALLFGVRGDYRIPRVPDTHWTEQVAAFRSLPPGTDFFIPVYPQPTDWGLTLRRGERSGGSDLLGRYPQTGKPSCAVIEMIGMFPPNSPPAEQKHLFAGYALDPTARAAAGAVFLQIDDRLFPATTGLVPTSALMDPTLAGTGFMRLVPQSDLTPGDHRLRVLTADSGRSGLLEPGPVHVFTVP